eukprot:6580610-Prymnesium_polylepis.1
MSVLLAAFLAVAAPLPNGRSVTGAAGRTGLLLYKYLKADPLVAAEVRALVYGSGSGSPDQRTSLLREEA